MTADLKSGDHSPADRRSTNTQRRTAKNHFSMLADIERLRIHVKDNIMYYMQAIWTHEPPDQRYFRIYNYEVPEFGASGTAPVTPVGGLTALDSARTSVGITLPAPKLLQETKTPL